MRSEPFTRPTIIAANELISHAAQKHTEINRIVLRLGLEAEIPADTSLGIEKKCDRLGRIVLDRSAGIVETMDGAATLAEAFVREAISFTSRDDDSAPQ